MANSTRLNTTFSSDTQSEYGSRNSEFTSAVIKNISFLRTTNATSRVVDSCNINRTSEQVINIPTLHTSDIQLADHFIDGNIQNVSQIPLPNMSNPMITHISNKADKLSHTSVFNSNVTENISFFTSFYVPQPIPNIHMQTTYDNHVYCYSPPKSPDNIITTRKSIQTTFKLNRIDLTTLDNNPSTQKCRICRSDINFDKLIIIANRMPTGRQIYCAPCVIMLTSKCKDRNVDYYTTLQ